MLLAQHQIDFDQISKQKKEHRLQRVHSVAVMQQRIQKQPNRRQHQCAYGQGEGCSRAHQLAEPGGPLDQKQLVRLLHVVPDSAGNGRHKQVGAEDGVGHSLKPNGSSAPPGNILVNQYCCRGQHNVQGHHPVHRHFPGTVLEAGIAADPLPGYLLGSQHIAHLWQPPSSEFMKAIEQGRAGQAAFVADILQLS
ncbi:hypothetical protein D3C75_834430 [compost metagenome]